MLAEIRRHQTTLICSGLAVIAFGFWSIVRTLLVLWFNMSQVRAAAEEKMPDDVFLSLDAMLIISCFVIFVFLFVDLAFRFYVGLSALSEGSGKQRRITYIVLSALFLVFSLCGQTALFISSAREELTVKIIVTLIIEISSNIAFIEIIRSSLTIRQYMRSGNAAQGEIYAA